ncbi:hypothetical protein [Fodinibius sediminis]|uniref:hypothetical protein n=1 Tax=Fodinibius sediminis TaxID=1214077 RepID=UPI00163D7100|nr:hypothetical protein [Fodinibius sediminis]
MIEISSSLGQNEELWESVLKGTDYREKNSNAGGDLKFLKSVMAVTYCETASMI